MEDRKITRQKSKLWEKKLSDKNDPEYLSLTLLFLFLFPATEKSYKNLAALRCRESSALNFIRGGVGCTVYMLVRHRSGQFSETALLAVSRVERIRIYVYLQIDHLDPNPPSWYGVRGLWRVQIKPRKHALWQTGRAGFAGPTRRQKLDRVQVNISSAVQKRST